jgi:uncharacterized protein (DUF2141 family)
MMPKLYRIVVLLLVVVLSSCARRGTITGGDKDTLAPVLLQSYPKNLSTGFKGKQIELTFDEYVKLKNVNKQLIISPPLKYQPEILPMNASKKITIKIKDTLRENTTYSLNFGQSIEDHNEGNPYSQFKYVFSTGSYIDSLQLRVKVKDALEKKVDNFVSVMLYEVDDTYTDSVVYKDQPRYITNTLDSLEVVTLDYLKAGKYQLVAVKSKDGANKYNPKKDKIGFQKQYITIPSDTIYEVELFKEKLPFNVVKPVQQSGNRLVMGYEGWNKKAEVGVYNNAEKIESLVTQFAERDSVQIWYKPVKADSLLVRVAHQDFKREFWTKSKASKKDTLSITSNYSSMIPLRESFILNSSTPLVKFDETKISITNKDLLAVPFTTKYNEWEQRLTIDFNKQASEKYTLKALPGAIVDFFDTPNDTLSYNLGTKDLIEFGNMKVVLRNVKQFPVIVQLTDEDGKVKAEMITQKELELEFLGLEPSIYTIRAIYDANNNGIWDTGSFLEKRQAEEVIYLNTPVKMNANWDWEQVFDLAN